VAKRTCRTACSSAPRPFTPRRPAALERHRSAYLGLGLIRGIGRCSHVKLGRRIRRPRVRRDRSQPGPCATSTGIGPGRASQIGRSVSGQKVIAATHRCSSTAMVRHLARGAGHLQDVTARNAIALIKGESLPPGAATSARDRLRSQADALARKARHREDRRDPRPRGHRVRPPAGDRRRPVRLPREEADRVGAEAARRAGRHRGMPRSPPRSREGSVIADARAAALHLPHLAGIRLSANWPTRSVARQARRLASRSTWEKALEWVERRSTSRLRAPAGGRAPGTRLKMLVVTGRPRRRQDLRLSAPSSRSLGVQAREGIASAPLPREGGEATLTRGHRPQAKNHSPPARGEPGGRPLPPAGRPVPRLPICWSSTRRPIGRRAAHALRSRRAVPPRAAVIFVGDVDQLPSVGPGRVLDDHHRLGRRAVPSRLTESLRRRGQPHHRQCAPGVNHGEMPEFCSVPPDTPSGLLLRGDRKP